MSSKRILGIAGAAMIGTLAGTGAVHAVISIDDDRVVTGITYALETLQSNRTYEVRDSSGGTTTYYEGADATSVSNETDVHLATGVILPATTDVVVDVELENLVIGDIAPTLVLSNAALGATPTPISGLNITRLSGGAEGDSEVQFGLTTVAQLPATTVLVISFGSRVGILPDKPGTITVKTTRIFAGAPVTQTTVLRDAIKTMRGVVVDGDPNNLTAAVASEFRKFKGGTDEGVSGVVDGGDRDPGRVAHVGTLRIHLASSTPPLQNARRGQGELTSVTGIISAAKISISGATAFLEENDDGEKLAYSSASSACSPVGSSLVDDNGAIEAALTDFDGATDHLCLRVDGETVIPETSYRASISYTVAAGSSPAFPPLESVEQLGSISRDGATVPIAHLTTNQKYRQQLVMVNRSSGSVSYRTTFQTEDGTEYEAGEAASGSLEPGRTVLEVSDMVFFDDGNNNPDGTPRGAHGSAVLSVSIEPSMLEVATVTTNKVGDDRSTDTVVWNPDP